MLLPFLVLSFGRMLLAEDDVRIEEFVIQKEGEANAAYEGEEEGREAFVEAFVTTSLFEEAKKIRLKNEWQSKQSRRVEEVSSSSGEISYVEHRNETRLCSTGLCGRVVAPHFAPWVDLAGRVDPAMQGLFHLGGVTSIAVDPIIDDDLELTRRVQEFVETRFETRLEFAGGLLTRIQEPPPQDEFQLNVSHVYWNPHVDKANVVAYDYSALLYLNDHGTHFQGGELEFFDDGGIRSLIKPAKGLLVAFDSGIRNLHRPRKLTKPGTTRLVLALWFTSTLARLV